MADQPEQLTSPSRVNALGNEVIAKVKGWPRTEPTRVHRHLNPSVAHGDVVCVYNSESDTLTLNIKETTVDLVESQKEAAPVVAVPTFLRDGAAELKGSHGSWVPPAVETVAGYPGLVMWCVSREQLNWFERDVWASKQPNWIRIVQPAGWGERGIRFAREVLLRVAQAFDLPCTIHMDDDITGFGILTEEGSTKSDINVAADLVRSTLDNEEGRTSGLLCDLKPVIVAKTRNGDRNRSILTLDRKREAAAIRKMTRKRVAVYRHAVRQRAVVCRRARAAQARVELIKVPFSLLPRVFFSCSLSQRYKRRRANTVEVAASAVRGVFAHDQRRHRGHRNCTHTGNL
jgi:hypothetical protein